MLPSTRTECGGVPENTVACQELWRDFLSWAEASGAQGLEQVMLGSMTYLYEPSGLQALSSTGKPFGVCISACTLEVLYQEDRLRGEGRWPSAWARRYPRGAEIT